MRSGMGNCKDDDIQHDNHTSRSEYRYHYGGRRGRDVYCHIALIALAA